MSETPGDHHGLESRRRPLRIAVVQIRYIPNHKPMGSSRLLLPQQPLIPIGTVRPELALSALLTNAQHEQMRSALRNSARDILDSHSKRRTENFDKKLRQILRYCHSNNVDIVVMPESAVPPQLVPTLLGYNLAVFAGLGVLRSTDIDYLTRSGFSVDETMTGCNIAAFAAGPERHIVSKRYAADGEDIEVGEGVRVVSIKTQASGERTIGLAICKDYLRESETLRTSTPRVDVVLATMLSETVHDFGIEAPRDFIRVLSNWAFNGGSTIVAPSFSGLYSHYTGTEPIPAGQEAVSIIDWDFFPTRLTPLDLPKNRIVRYASILDTDDQLDNSKTKTILKAMSSWTIDDYRRRTYSESLRTIAEIHSQGSETILSRAIDILSQQEDEGASLTRDDFSLLTSHIVLEDVLREEELRSRLLEDLIERWHRDRRSFPSPDAGLFMAAAEAQLRQLEPFVRNKHRSQRQAGPGLSQSRQSEGSSTTTFYSVRLGTYDSDQAAQTLPRQLDLLRTVAASKGRSVRLAYRLTTQSIAASGDLHAYFDVLAAADSIGEDTDDLVSGVGEQIGTVFGSAYDLSRTEHTYEMNTAWLAQLVLPVDYVPTISDDWSTLIDYLRTLPFPLQLQMTVVPSPSDDLPPRDSQPLDEPLGFLSNVEQSAAAFLTRAGRDEAGHVNCLQLAVHVGASEPVPHSVLQTIAHWLLRNDQYVVDATALARSSLESPHLVDGSAVLTPAEAVRLFHPPYGNILGRGLGGERKTTISLPARFAGTIGIELGTAVIASPQADRDETVRLSSVTRRHHLYILGRSGSGKTNLLKNLARQDIVAGNGLAVIDPHGDLVDYLVEHVTGREHEVTLLDFGDREYLPVLNPLDLDIRDDSDRTLAVEEFIDLVERQSFHEFYGPRFEDLTRLAIESVLDAGYPMDDRSLVDFPPILRTEARRSWLRGILVSNDLKSRWEQFEAQLPTDTAGVVHWALAKFSELTKDNILGQVLGGGASTASIRSVVENNGILLVKLPEWEMSRSAANFLGSFIQERIRRAVYSRWRQSPDSGRIPPFYLYVDEFQAFATTRFEEMVAEARKFGLCLTLSHQNIRQLQQFSRHTGGSSSSLLEAVFGNVSSMVYLGGSSRDEEIIAAELGVSGEKLRNLQRFGAVARVLFENESVACSLEFPLAAAVSGLPRSSDTVRRLMIDNSHWVKRDELRRRLEARFDRIAELVDLGWFSARSDVPDGKDRSNAGDDEPEQDDGEDDTDPDDADGDDDDDVDVEAEAEDEEATASEPSDSSPSPTNEQVGSRANLNISWPWPERADVKKISYSLCEGRLNIVIAPGSSGLRFLRKWVRFTRGSSYHALELPPYENAMRSRRRSDSLPIVVSVPYTEGVIEKVSYTIEEGMINIIYHFSAGVRGFRRADVRFTRAADPCRSTGSEVDEEAEVGHESDTSDSQDEEC